MIRTVDAIGGNQGGPVKLAADPGKARNIHVTVLNPTAAVHGIWFGRSQRELSEPTPTNIGQCGIAVIAVPNTVVNSTVGTVAYTTFLLQGWIGELWAVADAAGLVAVDVMDSGSPEK